MRRQSNENDYFDLFPEEQHSEGLKSIDEILRRNYKQCNFFQSLLCDSFEQLESIGKNQNQDLQGNEEKVAPLREDDNQLKKSLQISLKMEKMKQEKIDQDTTKIPSTVNDKTTEKKNKKIKKKKKNKKSQVQEDQQEFDESYDDSQWSQKILEQAQIQDGKNKLKHKKRRKKPPKTTKNLLVNFRTLFLSYLRREKSNDDGDFLQRFSRSSCVTRSDYEELMNHPDYRENLKNMFEQNYLYRELQISRVSKELLPLYMRKIKVFEMVWKKKKFPRLN